MPRPKYRLTPLIEIRERAKQDAARVVSRRREELAMAEAELVRREQAVIECRERQAEARRQMTTAAERGIQAAKLVLHRTHVDDLRLLEAQLQDEVEKQKTIVARAEAALDRALLALAEAARELQTVEKHRELWREQVKREAERRDQKLLDELGAARHTQQQRAKKK
ncbi:MAG: hypothetical protein ACKV2V_27895 [Blastocatellia bacterium]